MDELVEYLRKHAPIDVNETLEWLTSNGFVATSHRGPADESFGNVVIELQRDDLRVLVWRDRGQWSFDMAPPGDPSFVPAHVLQTAAWPATYRANYAVPGYGPDTPLPRQLPVGTVWAITLPLLADWLTETDRSAEIEVAQAQWRAAADEHWGRS